MVLMHVVNCRARFFLPLPFVQCNEGRRKHEMLLTSVFLGDTDDKVLNQQKTMKAVERGRILCICC